MTVDLSKVVHSELKVDRLMSLRMNIQVRISVKVLARELCTNIYGLYTEKPVAMQKAALRQRVEKKYRMRLR